MKILPFPGRQRMLCQRDGLRLQSERGRKEEMKRCFGGLLSSSHITRERMRIATQILLHLMTTSLIFVFYPQAVGCSCFTGPAQCCPKLLFCTSHVQPAGSCITADLLSLSHLTISNNLTPCVSTHFLQ